MMKPVVSIIIPTYNERANIKKLVPRIFEILSREKLHAEVVIVDDNSPDGTAEEGEGLGKKYDVHVVKRSGKLGLSSAVIDGFGHAKGDILGVMDADLSHPPEKIPEMVRQLQDRPLGGGYDVVFGSRRVSGGRIDNWPLTRKVISKGASILARPVTSLRDPMSGFFFLKRKVIGDKKLNPKGFKIGLEIAVKGSHSGIKEVPITFRDRQLGKSKMGRGEIVNYLLHILSLYKYRLLK